MREIKFRGKPTEDIIFEDAIFNISKDEFVKGYLIIDGKDAWIINGVVESNSEYIYIEQWIPVRLETIGQFTELHDKNGVEIWEGDIINYNELSNCEVHYRIGAYWVKNKEKGLIGVLSRLHPLCMEVIGTIHDNEVK